jgi:TetR/AcrR family transcriptional regulator, transcriptional repressor for nem operon
MRYQRQHKAEIHQKIVKDASRRVRVDGLTGTAVSSVMRDAGLTHGGFYKHFESRDEMLIEALKESFREITDRLVHAAERSASKEPWKAIIKTYLSLEFCDHIERGCPLPALAPELARVDKKMTDQILAALVSYKERMTPFMPGRRTADKERAFFAIFSTMAGAIEIARLLPKPEMREKVLASARELLLRGF